MILIKQATISSVLLGPARKLVEDDHGHFALSIDNGEWVIANDERYEETAGNAVATLTKECPDCLVTLKPLINQTARLKFTLYSAEDDPFVHSLKMQPVGIELSGLQRHYDKSTTGEPWNWTLCSPADTLIAYPGNKNVLMYLQEPLISTNDRFVIETPILPTDADCPPVICWPTGSVQSIPPGRKNSPVPGISLPCYRRKAGLCYRIQYCCFTCSCVMY